MTRTAHRSLGRANHFNRAMKFSNSWWDFYHWRASNSLLFRRIFWNSSHTSSHQKSQILLIEAARWWQLSKVVAFTKTPRCPFANCGFRSNFELGMGEYKLSWASLSPALGPTLRKTRQHCSKTFNQVLMRVGVEISLEVGTCRWFQNVNFQHKIDQPFVWLLLQT